MQTRSQTPSNQFTSTPLVPYKPRDRSKKPTLQNEPYPIPGHTYTPMLNNSSTPPPSPVRSTKQTNRPNQPTLPPKTPLTHLFLPAPLGADKRPPWRLEATAISDDFKSAGQNTALTSHNNSGPGPPARARDKPNLTLRNLIPQLTLTSCGSLEV